MTSSHSLTTTGPPYRPQVWVLGGTPQKSIDIPVTSVFLVLFALGAATHMTIFQLNKKRGHKFLFNLFLFIFCMSRIVTSSVRLASISIPTNIRLAIAAQVFVAAGILIIFVINLIWTQRIVRALHPDFGWHSSVRIFFRTLYVLILFTLAIVITASVQMFYSLRPRTRTIDRSLTLYGATFLMTVSFLPIPVILVALAIPRKQPLEKFGHGRFRTKIAILLTGATLCCLGAAYRCGTSWVKPVPLTQPRPAYFSKACFYVFNFTIEIIVVYLYALVRVDLRFWIPDGAKGPGSYKTKGSVQSAEGGEEAKHDQGRITTMGWVSSEKDSRAS